MSRRTADVVTPKEMMGICKRDAVRFRTWVTTSLHSMGSLADEYIFGMTLMLKFKGMSGTGLELLGRLGLCLSRNKLTEMLTLSMQKYDEMMSRSVSARNDINLMLRV